ncbi:MAG: alpha/beta hydrolase [Solirubrobacterales bacterium]|nr:alpha/beta hydrolase [Solirubrobacterales bacterium]
MDTALRRGYTLGMELAPKLIDVTVPDRPEGVVLVLHGGASRTGGAAVSPTQLSVLRMVPIAQRIGRAGKHRLAVFRLLNTQRGWDTHHTPVRDAQWALGQIAQRLEEELPTALVGHSLGGRAALLAAGHAAVRSVVALAPYVYPDDVPGGIDGKRLLIVHGTDDRVASPARSAELARRLATRADVGYVSVAGGKHAMLRHHAQFEGLAADFVTATLLGDEPAGPVARLEAGEHWIEV